MSVLAKVSVALALVLLLGIGIVYATYASDDAQTVNVTVTDETMQLSSNAIRPGKVNFVVKNNGAIPHEFTVQSLSSINPTQVGNGQIVAPGTSWTVQRVLPSGTYQLGCARLSHVQWGIAAKLSTQSGGLPGVPVQLEWLIPLAMFAIGSVYIIADSLRLSST